MLGRNIAAFDAFCFFLNIGEAETKAMDHGRGLRYARVGLPCALDNAGIPLPQQASSGLEVCCRSLLRRRQE